MDRRTIFMFLAASLLVAIATPPVHADTPTVVNPGTGDASPPVRTQNDDKGFVDRAAAAGFAEVEAGKIALERASSPAVRDIAQMLVDEHTRANAELAAVAKTAGVTVRPGTDDARRIQLQRMTKIPAADFDRIWLANQVAEHQGAIMLFREEATRGVDGPLKKFAASSIPMLESHLATLRRAQGQ